MPQVIDFKTKAKVEEAASAQDEEFPSFVEKILSKENIEGMKSGIVILWGDESEELGIWHYNAGDKDILWASEMLRDTALYPNEDEDELVNGA